MKMEECLDRVTRVYLDSAPVIYFVQGHPAYLPSIRPLFSRLDQENLVAVVSPVTLAECLVYPIRHTKPDLHDIFVSLLTHAPGIEFSVLDDAVAAHAARLRAEYNLELLDAFQVASAIASGCERLITNDKQLKRIREVSVVVLSELDP